MELGFIMQRWDLIKVLIQQLDWTTDCRDNLSISWLKLTALQRVSRTKQKRIKQITKFNAISGRVDKL